MSAVSAIRVAISYNLIFAIAGLFALMAYYNTVDPSTLGSTTSAGWANAFDTIANWMGTGFDALKGDFVGFTDNSDSFQAKVEHSQAEFNSAGL